MKKIHRSWMYMIKNQLEQSRFDHRKQGILQASSDENNETIKSNCVYFRDRVLVRTCYSRYGKKNKVGTSASKLKFFYRGLDTCQGLQKSQRYIYVFVTSENYALTVL